MSDGLTINLDGHMAAFSRMASASKKDLPTLWHQEARICFGGTSSMPGVADITPPYSQDTYRNARAAKEHADAKLEADIRSLYGTPGEAYEAIQSTAPAAASAFWLLQSSGQESDASDLLRKATSSLRLLQHLFQAGDPVAPQRLHPVVLFHPQVAKLGLPQGLPVAGAGVVPAGKEENAGSCHCY